MSLMAQYEDLEVIEITNASDGLGGFTETINVIENIKGVICRSSNKDIRIAEQLNNRSIYVLYTYKGSSVDYKKLVRRVSDNRIFKITSLAGDKKTPSLAGLNIEKFECEIYEKMI